MTPDPTPPDVPSPHGGTDGSAAEGRSDYAAARLLQRRPVRAALAASQVLRHGWRAGRELLGPAGHLVDLPGPAMPARPHYPHLRSAHLGARPFTDGLVPGQRVGPLTWRTVFRRDRPDILLLDDLDGWSDTALAELLAGAEGAAIICADAAVERVRATQPDTPLVRLRDVSRPMFDARATNPMGVPARPPLRAVTTGARAFEHGDHHPAVDDTAAVGLVRHGAVAVESASGFHDETAHARRVLHLLAGGTPTIASETDLLGQLLPEALAASFLAPEAELGPRCRWLLDSPDRELLGVRARRFVLGQFSFAARLDEVLDEAGLEPRTDPLISVLLSTKRAGSIPTALEAVARQRHPAIELILILHGIERPDDRTIAASGVPTTVVEVAAERPLGYALDTGLRSARGELIAKMDDDDLYGPDHLSDLVGALEYSGAAAVGRWSNVVYLEQQDVTVHQHLERQEVWATHLPGATMLVRGEVMRHLRWRHVPNAVDTELVRAIISSGEGVYSTHRFGFVRRRHGDHTFQRQDRGFRGEGETRPGLDRRALLI